MLLMKMMFLEIFLEARTQITTNLKNKIIIFNINYVINLLYLTLKISSDSLALELDHSELVSVTLL